MAVTPGQIVMDLKWTEDGQERRELFGPRATRRPKRATWRR